MDIHEQHAYTSDAWRTGDMFNITCGSCRPSPLQSDVKYIITHAVDLLKWSTARRLAIAKNMSNNFGHIACDICGYWVSDEQTKHALKASHSQVTYRGIILEADTERRMSKSPYSQRPVDQAHIHHIQPLNREDRNHTHLNKQSNLMVLCPECHTEMHSLDGFFRPRNGGGLK